MVLLKERKRRKRKVVSLFARVRELVPVCSVIRERWLHCGMLFDKDVLCRGAVKVCSLYQLGTMWSDVGPKAGEQGPCASSTCRVCFPRERLNLSVLFCLISTTLQLPDSHTSHGTQLPGSKAPDCTRGGRDRSRERILHVSSNLVHQLAAEGLPD